MLMLIDFVVCLRYATNFDMEKLKGMAVEKSISSFRICSYRDQWGPRKMGKRNQASSDQIKSLKVSYGRELFEKEGLPLFFHPSGFVMFYFLCFCCS